MPRELSHEQRREIQAHFAQADRDRDHRINLSELRELLIDLEGDMSEEEVAIGFDAIDTDEDGLIDFNEFLAWWQEL
jgi:Ca2+-binding EF-hand superfamily protein